MERNAGMSFEMISSSALGSNDLHLYQNMDADDSVKSLNYSLSEQLDLEVQKLEEMVKCLESLERDLQPSEQLRQTTSETCQTNGALNNQNVYVNVDIDEMERPQRSGIPIPRRSSRGATGISPTSSEMKSPPPLARKPKVERHEAGLVKLSYRDEGKMAERPEENYNLGNKETVQLQNSDVDDTKSYTESVSVSSTANMFGGQAIIRRIPTPNSRSRQESNQPKVPSIKNIGNEQNNIEHDDDDVLDQPLKSLSEINGISDLESYDNIDNNEIPSYEQFLDEAIENTDKTVADFKAGKIPMDIEPTKIEHEYATMDYTILGTISSIKDDGANKGDNSKEEMSFVFGRPKLPIVSDSSLKRCLSPPYDSKVTFSQSAPSKRVASGLRSRPLPPLPPGARERSKLREITNHVGIMCEGCNNCLLELKRQSLRLMYPGGETRAVI